MGVFSNASTVKKWFLILAIPGIIFHTWSYAYVLRDAYEWFIRSQFTSLPVISVIQFIGISVFLNLSIKLKTRLYKSKEEKEFKKTDKYFLNYLGVLFFSPWAGWATLWIIQKIIY